MSHMTVGQLTPDLVMTLKMRSTYCRRFSCNEMWVGHPNSAHVDPTLSQAAWSTSTTWGGSASRGQGPAQSSLRELWQQKIQFPSWFLKKPS